MKKPNVPNLKLLSQVKPDKRLFSWPPSQVGCVDSLLNIPSVKHGGIVPRRDSISHSIPTPTFFKALEQIAFNLNVLLAEPVLCSLEDNAKWHQSHSGWKVCAVVCMASHLEVIEVVCVKICCIY